MQTVLASDSPYVSGTFWVSVALAVLAAATITVTLILWRRGNPRPQITYDARLSRLVSPHAPSTAQIEVTLSGMSFVNPYLLELRVESRSRRDIGSDDFDRQKPLAFRLDTPVAVQIGDTTIGESAEIAIDDGVIAIGPCLIRKGTILFTQFLTEGRPDLKTDNTLRDVKVSGKTFSSETGPEAYGPRPPSGFIDFRYHLVSLVAVFLALAIGILLGTTELSPMRTGQHSNNAHSSGSIYAHTHGTERIIGRASATNAPNRSLPAAAANGSNHAASVPTSFDHNSPADRYQ